MALEPGTPEFVLDKLHNELVMRQAYFERMERYARGDQDSPTLAGTASRFARLAELSTTNILGLVVDKRAERIQPVGFRFGGSPDADDAAWRIWQANDFDAESHLAIRAALTYGRSFVSVEPNPANPETPRMFAEDPRQVIVAYEPGNRRRRIAALKIWGDEWTGDHHANLYLPDRIFKYRKRSAGPIPVPGGGWEASETARNTLGEVPFYELKNRPEIDGSVHSEIEDLIVMQDRLNRHIFNEDAVGEFGAFRQKWVTGMEVPLDANGAPIQLLNAHVAELLIAENPDTRFGDFNATDLSGYIAKGLAIIDAIARRASIPPTAMPNSTMANINGETLAGLEAGHVMQCRNRTLGYEPAFEDQMRAAFRSYGDPRASEVMAETIWQTMWVRSPAQDADRASKLKDVGIPVQQLEEDLGYSETQRARMAVWRAENDAALGMAALFGAQDEPPEF